MQASIFFSLLLFSLCAASCTHPPYKGADVLGADEFVIDSYKIRDGKLAILEMIGKSCDTLSSALLEEYVDVIHEGDILIVVVLHPSRTDIAHAVQTINGSIGFRVSSGCITLPDLEPVQVKGLTLEQAQQAIHKEYLQHLPDISVFLAYRERTERKVELAGLVSLSSIPVDGRLRLFEVLSLAKVPPQANLFKSYVVRDGTLLPVDMFKLVKEGDMTQNIVMQGGDKIYVAEPSAASLMVLGEVGKEKVVDLPNGSMTLKQALAEAGGISLAGDRRYIQVIRGTLAHPKIYTLTWQHIIHLPSDSMLVMPGDIVYVAATPIAEWGRFVNIILPTLVGFDLLTKGVKGVGVNIND